MVARDGVEPPTPAFSATLCCIVNNLSDFRWPPKYLRSRERQVNRGLKSWVQDVLLMRKARATITVLFLSSLALPLVAVIAIATTKAGVSESHISAVPGPFVDVTENLGIHFHRRASPTSKKYLLETMGSGVALFDYDNDDRLDIFFANGARLDDPTSKGGVPKKDSVKYWNRFYHQKPDGTFEDVTEKAGLSGIGYSTGVAVGDYDNDGFEDLYVAGYDRGTLDHNNGDGT